jgi:hypothetical protein
MQTKLHSIHHPSGLSVSYVVITRRSAGQGATLPDAINDCFANGAAPDDVAGMVLYMGLPEMIEKIRPNPNFGVIFRPEPLIEINIIRPADELTLGQLIPVQCPPSNN